MNHHHPIHSLQLLRCGLSNHRAENAHFVLHQVEVHQFHLQIHFIKTLENVVHLNILNLSCSVLYYSSPHIDGFRIVRSHVIVECGFSEAQYRTLCDDITLFFVYVTSSLKVVYFCKFSYSDLLLESIKIPNVCHYYQILKYGEIWL